MVEKSTFKSQAKCKKLIDFTNLLIWSMIIKLMPIEKDVWDLVSTGLQLECQNPILFSKEVKEDQIMVEIGQQIILKGVNDQIIFNIIDLEDPKEM